MQVIHPSELRKITKKEAMKLLKAVLRSLSIMNTGLIQDLKKFSLRPFIQVMRDNDPTGSALYCKEPK